MVKVKLTTKVDSDILVVGLTKVNNKLQIESNGAQLESVSLLATLTAIGATAKADEVIKLPGKNTKLVIFTGLGDGSSILMLKLCVVQQELPPGSCMATRWQPLLCHINQ